MITEERQMLLVKLISAVMANATIDGDNININLSVAMEMVDKVLVEFEILKIRRSH